jgi:pyruvate/2-oxoglutarate dehydrogenase complex dihydrolipoamide acyltransferase (E2) component
MANEPENNTPATPVTPAAPPAANPPPAPKFTQDDMDSVAGNRAKEAAAAERKRLYKELGIDPDDPKALDSVKGKLTAAEKAAEASKTEMEKLADKAEKEAAKRAELEAKIADMEQKQLIGFRNGEVTKALITAKVNASEAEDLMLLMQAKFPEVLTGVLSDDGKIDQKGMKALLAKAQEAYPRYFANPAPGSPSNYDGRVPTGSKSDAFKQANAWRPKF